MFKKLLLTTSLFFSLSTTLLAGVLLEPYLGAAIGFSGESTYSDATTKPEFSFLGVNIGGRVGYSFLGFMGGLDYSMAKHNLKTDYNNISYKDGISRSQLGIFVGYELPILLRVWGTYFVKAELDGDDTAKDSGQFISKDTSFDDGSGIALGAGFTGLPFVSINFEYRRFEYDTEFEKGVKDATHTGTTLSELLLSVSLPLDL